LNLFYQPQIPEGIHQLDEEESRHCVRVLRKRAGDTIRVTDGRGQFYDARIAGEDARACTFHITAQHAAPVRPYRIHIAISPTKNADRLEWFVEKAVEFGIDTITLLECHNTERTYHKTERLQKVVVSAMKQSMQAWLPEVQGLTSFKEVISTPGEQKFIAFVDSSNPLHLKHAAQPGGDYLVLIGPEGDFTASELEDALGMNFHKVSLGASRLRTETAGLAACHTLHLVNTP
jgi:16S rRNA (uracil1498-N3)-methyltransferase